VDDGGEMVFLYAALVGIHVDIFKIYHAAPITRVFFISGRPSRAQHLGYTQTKTYRDRNFLFMGMIRHH